MKALQHVQKQISGRELLLDRRRPPGDSAAASKFTPPLPLVFLAGSNDESLSSANEMPRRHGCCCPRTRATPLLLSAYWIWYC